MMAADTLVISMEPASGDGVTGEVLAQGGSGSWARFDVLHDSAMALPSSPGLVSHPNSSDGVLVLVHNLRSWLTSNRAELAASCPPDGGIVEWAVPPQHEMERLYVQSRGALTALRQAPPTQIPNRNALERVPSSWGLYRIRKADGRWYVGISSNLRSRLLTHARSGMVDFAAGDDAEFILAKSANGDLVVTWHDLQAAERDHIRRMRGRGITLVNRVSGGNGLPPAERFFLTDLDNPRAHPLDASRARRARWERNWTEGTRPAPLINTGLTVSDVTGEWRLYFEANPEVRLVAMAPGDGPWSYDEHLTRRLALAPVIDRYSRGTGGRDLVADLDTLLDEYGERPTRGIGAEQIQATFWWPTVGRATDDGGREIVPAALRQYTSAHVVAGTVPRALAEQGLQLDPSFNKGNNLNKTIRLVNAEGARIYVKKEENQRANRAEVLASLIWYRLGWRGVTRRSVLSEDGSIIIMAPIGGADVEDRGSFAEAFKARTGADLESPRTIAAVRANQLMRVTLERLRLADDLDVVRFVVVNAAWGNTDRHSGNTHYGWQRVADGIDGGVGHLLPIDHGRCFLNNVGHLPGVQDVIIGSPADAVTGKLGNPHQLLRPFSQLVRSDRASVVAAVAEWTGKLGSVVEELLEDPLWTDFTPELSSMSARIAQVAESPEAFIDDVAKVVIW